jgi:hypothetical protein
MWEPRVVTHRVYGGLPALTPLFNAIREAKEVALRGPSSLVRKLSGGPGPYQGLWRLVEKTYHALDAGAPMPLDHRAVWAVNLWVHAVLEEAPSR